MKVLDFRRTSLLLVPLVIGSSFKNVNSQPALQATSFILGGLTNAASSAGNFRKYLNIRRSARLLHLFQAHRNSSIHFLQFRIRVNSAICDEFIGRQKQKIKNKVK